MKIDLYPEDMLLSYVAKLLNGEINPVVEGTPHLKHLPAEIDFSEEFAEKWQAMVAPAMKRFVASTFGLRHFLFDVEGYTKRFAATDQHFWETVDLKFSHRAAQRLYELMVFPVHEIQPLYQVATPADAMLISICIKDFKQYSFAWLQKNSASWLVQAVFLTWQQARLADLPWRHLLRKPAEVELPLRDYMIEKVADYLAGCTFCVTRTMEDYSERSPRVYSAEQVGGLELSVQKIMIIGEWLNYIQQVIADTRSAIAFWTGEGTANIDDERFIAGAARNFGFDNEVAEFERRAGMFREGVGLKEAIYESILRNQTSA